MSKRLAKKCVKVRYRSKADAITAVKRLQDRDREPTAVYYCRRCRGFHMTSQPQDGFRRPGTEVPVDTEKREARERLRRQVERMMETISVQAPPSP